MPQRRPLALGQCPKGGGARRRHRRIWPPVARCWLCRLMPCPKFTEGRRLLRVFQGPIPGDQLAGIRCRAGSTGQPDGVVHRGGGVGMACAGDQRRAGAASQSIRRSPLRPASHFAWCSTSCRCVRPKVFCAPIADLLGVDIAIPDHTTLSRPAVVALAILLKRLDRAEPLHLLVDSTGPEDLRRGRMAPTIRNTAFGRADGGASCTSGLTPSRIKSLPRSWRRTMSVTSPKCRRCLIRLMLRLHR